MCLRVFIGVCVHVHVRACVCACVIDQAWIGVRDFRRHA